MSLPHASGTDGAKGEKHTQGDAQAPDSLHLIARGLVGASPDPVVDLLHVRAHGVQERCGCPATVGQCDAVEVGEGLSYGDCDDDDGDQEGAV